MKAFFELILDNGKLMEIKRRSSNKMSPLNEKDAKTAESFVNRYYENIIDECQKFEII